MQYVTARLRDFQSRNRLTGRARLSLSQTVPLCLTLLSSRVSYRTLSRLYRLEKGNIHRIFFFFCKCVNTLRDEHIRWPRGNNKVLLCNIVSRNGEMSQTDLGTLHLIDSIFLCLWLLCRTHGSGIFSHLCAGVL